MKEFTNNASKGYNIVHMDGDKDLYDVNIENGNLIYENGTRKYVISGEVDDIGFPREDIKGNTVFKRINDTKEKGYLNDFTNDLTWNPSNTGSNGSDILSNDNLTVSTNVAAHRDQGVTSESFNRRAGIQFSVTGSDAYWDYYELSLVGTNTVKLCFWENSSINYSNWTPGSTIDLQVDLVLGQLDLYINDVYKGSINNINSGDYHITVQTAVTGYTKQTTITDTKLRSMMHI